MNTFDLDTLGERLVDLDKNDELFNCTAQLVLAAAEYKLISTCPYTDRGNAADKALSQALKPFCKEQ